MTPASAFAFIQHKMSHGTRWCIFMNVYPSLRVDVSTTCGVGALTQRSRPSPKGLLTTMRACLQVVITPAVLYRHPCTAVMFCVGSMSVSFSGKTWSAADTLSYREHHAVAFLLVSFLCGVLTKRQTKQRQQTIDAQFHGTCATTIIHNIGTRYFITRFRFWTRYHPLHTP